MAAPRTLLPSRAERNDVVDLGLLGVAALGALVALATGLWLVALAAVLPSLTADLVRGPRPMRLRRIAHRLQLDQPARAVVRTGLVAAPLAGAREVRALDLVAFLVAVLVVDLGQVAYVTLAGRALDTESSRIRWRNLDVGGAMEGPAAPADPVARRIGLGGWRVLVAAEVPVFAGALFAALNVPGAGALGPTFAVLAVAGCVAIAVEELRGRGSQAAAAGSDSALEAAVADLAPEVVFYFASPASGTYALGVWTDVINACTRPTLVILREAVHLDGVAGIRAPIVVPTTVADLERVVPPSVAVVLYPTNVTKNNDMVRIPGPMHCFIGHGDSDKVGSFSPLNRMYDEIWVAGQAAIDRYAAVDEGIDMGALRAVGRPQLAEIARAVPKAAGDDRLTLLYAPTWEGFFEEADYSSVATMGVGLVRGALDAGVRVLFKPHPLTGHRLPAALRAREEIEALVGRGTNGSALVPPGPDSLYQAFNEADALASDISSVITDFLASRKPYLVTNKHDVPRDEFVAAFPSTGAAYLIGSALTELPDALAAIRGADPLAEARQRLSVHLLGDTTDPLASFLGEIDAFVGRSERRRLAARGVLA
jgi:hypothetical protein